MIPMKDCCYIVGLGLLSIVALSQGQDYSTAAGTSTTPASCIPVPNVVRSGVLYDYDSFLTVGPWYGYVTYISDVPSATRTIFDMNMVNYYSSIGKTVQPGGTQDAQVIIQEKRRYINGTCTYMVEVGLFTADGVQFGPYFDGITSTTDDFNVEGNDASILWSSDQSTYLLFFWCATQNRQTGNCASTYIYAYTRTKPIDMSAAQKQAVDSAMNAVLKPHCIDISMFAQYQYDSRPECPPSPRPSCIVRLISAFDGDDLVLPQPTTTTTTPKYN